MHIIEQESAAWIFRKEGSQPQFGELVHVKFVMICILHSQNA
jgi:hypothetical protein